MDEDDQTLAVKPKKLKQGNKGHKDYGKWLVYNQGKMVRYRQKMRLQALIAYSPGGVPRCACPACPENSGPHLEFLTLDHIDGDGAAHRQSLIKTAKRADSGTSLALYCWLRDNNFPPGFQVLCYNCNSAKGTSQNQKCPHEI